MNRGSREVVDGRGSSKPDRPVSPPALFSPPGTGTRAPERACVSRGLVVGQTGPACLPVCQEASMISFCLLGVQEGEGEFGVLLFVLLPSGTLLSWSFWGGARRGDQILAFSFDRTYQCLAHLLACSCCASGLLVGGDGQGKEGRKDGCIGGDW